MLNSTIAVAPNQAFLNIDAFFFYIIVPTVSFILGRLGIPIFVKTQFQAVGGRAPNDTFFFLLVLSQALNELPPHSRSLAGTEPGPAIEPNVRCAAPSLPVSPASSSCSVLCAV